MKWDFRTQEICIIVMLVFIFCVNSCTYGGVYSHSPSIQGGFQITSDTSDQEKPAIYQNIVVWEDMRNGNWDIYGYDLSTQQEFQITSDRNDQREPAIYQNIVVWEDSRNGGNDIYGYDLSVFDKDGDGYSMLEDCKDNDESVGKCMAILAIIVQSGGNGMKASVYFNGLNRGETDLGGRMALYDLEVGKEYTIRVEAEWYNPEEKTVTIEEGKTQIEFRMKRKTDYIIFIGSILISTTFITLYFVLAFQNKVKRDTEPEKMGNKDGEEKQKKK
jgi:beta propeller repeat protein